MNETAVTVAIFGTVQIGTLIWLLSGLKTTVKDHGERITAVEKKADATALNVAELKGELRA